MTKRTLLAGLAVVASGGIASHLVGSRPQAFYGDSPLAPCPGVPNCALVRVPLAAPVEQAETAALDAVRGPLPWWTGRLVSAEPSARRIEAVFAVGPFHDQLAVAVEAEGDGSVLWVRSASSVGRSDLGLNRARVRRVVDAVRANLA